MKVCVAATGVRGYLGVGSRGTACGSRVNSGSVQYLRTGGAGCDAVPRVLLLCFMWMNRVLK